MWTIAVFALLALLTKRFHSVFFSLPRQDEKVTSHQRLKRRSIAEIDGGPLPNRTSVFLHLEEGLARNLDKPAIIAIHQSADHLSNLVALCTEKQNQQHADVDAAPPVRKERDEQVRNDYLKLSYRQVHFIAQQLAAGMLANGAQPNSTILMLIPNGAEFGLLLWTSIIARLTITCADADTLRATGPGELEYLLRSIKPSLVVVQDAETANEVDSLVKKLQLAKPLGICLDQSMIQSHWKTLTDLAVDGIASKIDGYQLVEGARNDEPQRIHSILFTSGSSGRPKGCPMRVAGQTHYMHSQAWLVDRRACPMALQQAHPSRGIAHLQTLLTWKAGGAVVMTGRGLSVSDIVEAVRNFPITFIALSPPMVHEIGETLAMSSLDTASVSTVQVGGDAVTKGILMRCAASFPRARVVVAHGMTEGGGSFYWPFYNIPIPQMPYFGELCPVGAVSPGSMVRILNKDQQRMCDRGEPGELHASSGSLIHHYMFGVSESSFYDDEKGRWFNTGDIAVMDDEGIVSILGRSKDMIKRDGAAIMPAPLENCIEMLTREQTVVVGIPHGTTGYEPFAVLRSLAGEHTEDISKHVEDMLGKQYVPGGILSLKQLGLDEFPVNATHKIVRSEMQKAVLQYLECSGGKPRN